jgi:putative hydrolase of the HAD superfamily
MRPALLFDYGNTLIAFGPEQQKAQLAAMEEVLSSEGIAYDPGRLDSLRMEQVMRPYRSDGVENKWDEVCREVVELFAEDPDGRVAALVSSARQRAFRESVRLIPETGGLLRRLKSRYRLGLLSNYPCVDSIRDSLRHLGILDLFDTVVVSGEVGFAKPHPRPFETLLRRMDLSAGEAVYIGDNWLADIQGAGRLGLRTVWVREHVPYERFDPADGDLPATAEIERILDLETVLENWEAE